MYFNDDLALLRPICISDFYSKENGYILYNKRNHITLYGKNKLYELKCPQSCQQLRFDGKCDSECNRYESYRMSHIKDESFYF